MKRKMLLPRTLLGEVLDIQKGKIFTLEFTKQDGTQRRMNCRRGVTSPLKGGENPLRYGNHPHLRVVFDMQKKDYRMVNLGTATKLMAGGVEHIIVG